MAINHDFITGNDAAFENIWGELKMLYGPQLKERPWYNFSLTEAYLQKWANQINLTDDKLLEKIAIRLAYGFYTHELDFTFCDAVISDMFGTDIGRECTPNLFWQIYLAFDSGEFYREGKRDEDPAEIYTRPQIAEIIASIEIESKVSD